MRPLLIVVAHECRKAPGLSSAVWRRWPHGFQKREMKPLVSAILLRMAGIDPFVPDAELDPPHRQRRQAGGPGRGEWRAVVGADHLRQLVLAERPLKRRFTLGILRTAGRRQADQIAAEAIVTVKGSNGAHAQPDPALVIKAPHMVGVLRLRQLPQTRGRSTPHPMAANQSRPFENLAGRRGRWPFNICLASL